MSELIGSFNWELNNCNSFVERQIELGSFQLHCDRVRESNKVLCKKYKQYWEDKPVTSQEELFSKLFNHEKNLVKDMSDLELTAHTEELSRIAFEARARLTAIEDEKKIRRTKNKKATGFERSVEADSISSDAINAINARKGKMTKIEKAIEGLVGLGMSREDAEKMCSAGTVLSQMRKQGDSKPAATFTSPFSIPAVEREKLEEKAKIDEANEINNPARRNADKPFTFVNPFAK